MQRLSLGLAVIFSLALSSTRAQDTGNGTCQDTHILTFQCRDNRTCVDRRKFCDGYDDCGDGSDEVRYNETAHSSLGGTSCARIAKGVPTMCHLPRNYVCDHEIDCYFGSDECDCPHAFRCVTPIAGRQMCRLRVQFCDNVAHCADGSDEWKYEPGVAGFQCAVTKTRIMKKCMLPEVHTCDGANDCDDGTDECFCNSKTNKTVFLNANCFRCLDESLVVPAKQLCDSKFHCSDLTDECLCPHSRPPLCDQVCKVGQDCGSCLVGQVRCTPFNNTSKCINRTQVCNNQFDCPNKEDERNCAVHWNEIFNCSDGVQYIPKYRFLDNFTDCGDGSDEIRTNALYRCTSAVLSQDANRKGAYDFSTPQYTTACDLIPDCQDLDDECNATLCGSDLPGYCNYTRGIRGFVCPNSDSAIIGKEVCDGFPTCNDTEPHLSADELNCPNRFYCNDSGKSGLPIHIPLESRCDLLQDCQDASDEMGCSNDTHFYCPSGVPKFVSRLQMCNGIQNCEDGMDECQNCSQSPFSSDFFLIHSYFLQVVVWITGVSAFFGNIAALIYNILYLKRSRSRRSATVNINRILVINLNIADFLLGVYLICLGTANSVFENDYCREDALWRGSPYCSAMGVVAMISIECSVFILTIMTTNRILVLRSITRFKSANRVLFVILCAWVLALLMAVIPLLPSTEDYFTVRFKYPNNPFLTTPNRETLKNLVDCLYSLEEPTGKIFSNASSNSHTWQSMIASVAKLNESLVPDRKYGYYSAHGVCLPRLFPNPQQDTSWGYSVFMMVINFCAFVYMASAYFFIYRYSTKVAKAANRRRTRTQLGLQTKITRIVFTNFCCWIPICIMAFLSVAGVQLSGDTYAVAAIVLLPINSAANPFLYSKLPDLIWKKIRGKRMSTRSTARRNSTMSGTKRSMAFSLSSRINWKNTTSM